MNNVSIRLQNIIFYCSIILFVMSMSVKAQLETNGSFENTAPGIYGTGTGIDGWVIEVGASVTTPPVFEVVTDNVHDGSNAIKVKVNASGTQPWDIQLIADSIPVQPGDTYSYSIWAKADSAAQANFTVGNYSFAEYGVIRPATITTEWQEFTIEFIITDNQTVIRGPIHFSVAANVGRTFYLDHLRISRVADPTDLFRPVIVEAEDGELGSDYAVTEDGDSSYISIQSNTINGGNPGAARRIATYEVTFADTGVYDLFARVRTNAGGFDDDSYFYGNGFGVKDSVADDDWITVNGLAAAGFSGTNDIVRDAGGLGNEIWKWVNLSRNGYQNAEMTTFTVNSDSLTQTIQIGGREDGLDIDKLAFGKSSLYYTVGNLDNGEPGSTTPPVPAWEGPPLATGLSKWVGSAYSGNQTTDFELYWNQVTPENAGKWGSVEGTRDNMNWSGLDAAYDFAKENGFPFHFHVLVWGQQQPGWISALSAADQLEEIREWFEAVAERYPDIEYLEVVNEPLLGHNPPDGGNGRANYKEALGGNGATGWDWVINAFKMAREIFPDSTKLMLNDFNIINSSTATAQYLNLVRLLQAENLIDIVAEQGHAFTTTGAVTTMRRNLDSLASTGLPIQITELDIDGTDDQIQLQSYQRIFPALYEHPGVEGITLWGWRPGLWRQDEGAYIINSDGSERPSLQWLREYLDTVSLPVVSVNDLAEIPMQYQLHNNYPNPFNPTTTISFSLPEISDVNLVLVDILGKEVMKIASGNYGVGTHSIRINASGLSSGVYFYKLQAGNFVSVKKLMLMK